MSRLLFKLLILFFASQLSMALLASEMQDSHLYDFNGASDSIDNYTGKDKWLVVMFWASDCQVCNEEAGSYNKFYNKHNKKNISMLGVSMDGASKKSAAIKFIKRHQLDFPNLIGEPGNISALYTRLTYEVWLGTPMFLIYSPEGKLVASQVGAIPIAHIEKFIEERANSSFDNKKEPVVR